MSTTKKSENATFKRKKSTSKRETKTFSIVLEVEIHARLLAAASDDRRTLSGYVNQLLDKHVPAIKGAAGKPQEDEDADLGF